MTTTIDLPDDILKKTMENAGVSSPQAAIEAAVREFNERHEPASQPISDELKKLMADPGWPRSQKDLIPLLGTLEGFMTPEELDEMRSMD